MTRHNAEVAARIRAHHEQMVAELEERLHALLHAVRRGEPYRPALAALAGYVEQEILPHAQAEEETLYAAAAGRGKALVDALTAEHVTIRSVLDELRAAGDAVAAVAAGSALAALFRSHAAKENDALLSLLMEEPAADLERLLAGMHDRLLGAHAAGCAGQAGPAAGNGGEAGQGGAKAGDPGAGTGAGAGDGAPELDVRSLPPAQRHPLIFATFASMAPGQAFILVNDHDPKPLYYRFAAEHPGAFRWDYLETGPTTWRVRIGKV